MIWKEKILDSRRNLWVAGIILLLSCGLYVIDIKTPWQYSIWLLYIFPLLLTYGLPSKNVFLIIPVILTLLNVGGFYFDPKRMITKAEIFSRMLGIAILWITVILIRLRKKIDMQLQQKISDLNTSNRELEQFAYAVSHDLREPLRTVGSFSDLLARRYLETLGDTGREFIGHIREGVLQMQKLIESLLEISRAGRSRSRMEWVDCNSLVAEVTRGLHILIEEKQANIEYRFLPRIYAQESALAQLFHNLIHNALKFHGPQLPSILIQAGLKKGHWLFSIQDNGIGIDPDHFDRIFMLFQRLHSEKTYPGSGIGLAVCKKIVERYDGKIWVESVPGHGSTFYFTLRADKGGENE